MGGKKNQAKAAGLTVEAHGSELVVKGPAASQLP